MTVALSKRREIKKKTFNRSFYRKTIFSLISLF